MFISGYKRLVLRQTASWVQIIMKETFKIIFFLTLFCSCIQKNERMPADFNFSFSFDSDKFNSADSTFIRQYNLRDTTIKLILTKEEKQNIYTTMIKNKVFELPTRFDRATDAKCIMPSSSDMLLVKANNKKLFFCYEYSCFPKKNKDASDRYLRIADTIKNIILNKKEIKQLKQSNIISL